MRAASASVALTEGRMWVLLLDFWGERVLVDDRLVLVRLGVSSY